jgi:phospholipase C
MTAEKKNCDMSLLKSASVPTPFNTLVAFNTNTEARMLSSSLQKCLYLTTAVAALSTLPFCNSARAQPTDTPIKHVIVFIGENRSFDNIYATYKPKGPQSIANLLSSEIVKNNGTPSKNYSLSMQFQIIQKDLSTYFIDALATPHGKTAYQTSPGKPLNSPPFPPPNTAYVPTAPGPAVAVSGFAQGPFDNSVSDSELATLEPSLDPEDLGLLRTGASNLPMFSTDTRVVYDKNNAGQLPNGSFQITGPTMPYDSYTGDMVHRLFHMWQQSDCHVAKNATTANPSGCLNDLYPFVGVARNDGSGANSMGFYNVARGDAPIFKQIADQYTINDNYHQPVMGGTAVQHQMLGTADAIPWDMFQGVTQPPASAIANPNPKSSTNAAFTLDGNWTNCSDANQPGIAAIVNYLRTLPWKPKPNCDPNRFYMINNMSPGFLPNGDIDMGSILSGSKVPPSSLRNIGDALNEKMISWAYYGGGYNAAVRVANGIGNSTTDPVIAANYCDICNPFSYAASIMGDPTQRKLHIKDAIDFFNDLASGNLPSVSYLKPDSLIDGHPASAKLDLFEGMLKKVLDGLQANPGLFAETALFVTVDEGGGYWDSGTFQPLDFFGDGPRIPLIVVSPYSTGGNVVHSYNDHASVVKFIERNWGLGTLSTRSRDNLPNPTMDLTKSYVPTNAPAIGDLYDMFNFGDFK